MLCASFLVLCCCWVRELSYRRALSATSKAEGYRATAAASTTRSRGGMTRQKRFNLYSSSLKLRSAWALPMPASLPAVHYSSAALSSVPEPLRRLLLPPMRPVEGRCWRGWRFAAVRASSRLATCRRGVQAFALEPARVDAEHPRPHTE